MDFSEEFLRYRIVNEYYLKFGRFEVPLQFELSQKGVREMQLHLIMD